MTLRPKSIGFDRCGTLTCFPMRRMACDLCEGRLSPERMHLFVKDLDDPRFGVVMGGCKPYGQILEPAWRRACKRRGLATAGGPGRAASRRGRTAHHAAGHPQNRSFNQAPPCDRGVYPVARCSNAFTPLGENHGR